MQPKAEGNQNPKLNLYVERVETTLRQLIKLLNNGTISPQQQNQILTGLLHLSNGIPELSRLIGNLQAQVQHLAALAQISETINSSLNTNAVLKSVIDTIIKLTGAERAFLMLKNELGELHLSIARNWENENLTPQEVAISSTVAKRVMQDGKAVLTVNAQEDPRFSAQMSVVSYSLRSIICVPLKTKEGILGIIYADNRSQSGLFSEEDLSTLEAFANQAAIAIYNARLYQQLQNAYSEIQEAYNSTLSGWARALDLRDHDTEEHTRRVTDLTLKLAEQMQLPADEMLHIERGAILHDIGKMGIPDSILNKPGPLTPEERIIIEKHPNLARQMLSQIEFLKPAMDIPYYHHEKWDGTGYPLKLQGEEIPLSARIFAVVDVWDALTTNRPYRAAMLPKEAARYIKGQAGKHFDPQVVEQFLKFIIKNSQL